MFVSVAPTPLRSLEMTNAPIAFNSRQEEAQKGDATRESLVELAQRREGERYALHSKHLNEMWVRVLKTIGYDQPYQSPIPPLMQRDSVDWVTPTTPVGVLGFP